MLTVCDSLLPSNASYALRRLSRSALSLSSTCSDSLAKAAPHTDMAKRARIALDKSGGLKGSLQHWPAVYPPEFEIPTFVAVGY